MENKNSSERNQETRNEARFLLRLFLLLFFFHQCFRENYMQAMSKTCNSNLLPAFITYYNYQIIHDPLSDPVGENISKPLSPKPLQP